MKHSTPKTPKFTFDFEYPLKPYVPKDNFPKSKGLFDNYTTLLLLLLPLLLANNTLRLTLWQALILFLTFTPNSLFRDEKTGAQRN